MNRLPLYGTVIVLANCGAIVWHLLVLARLHSMLSDGQILLIAALVNLVPFTALLLLWTRFRKIAGWLLLASLGIGLLIGTYEHFLSSSPDNVLRMAPGEWSSGTGAASAVLSPRAQVLWGLKSGLKSPLLWAPVLGIVVVLLGLHIPKGVASCFAMIGSATSGVAVFTVGLTLAAHAFHLSKAVLLSTLGRITVQTAVLLALFHLLHVQSPFAREALVCCSFPLATIVVLLAAKYKTMEAESASALLLSTLSLVLTVPIIIAISR
jgi:malonate transporter and related proteins